MSHRSRFEQLPAFMNRPGGTVPPDDRGRGPAAMPRPNRSPGAWLHITGATEDSDFLWTYDHDELSKPTGELVATGKSINSIEIGNSTTTASGFALNTGDCPISGVEPIPNGTILWGRGPYLIDAKWRFIVSWQNNPIIDSGGSGGGGGGGGTITLIEGGDATASETISRERRDTAAGWLTSNPILEAGERGLETDTLKEKIGDGGSSWTTLAYVSDGPQSNPVFTYDVDGNLTLVEYDEGHYRQFYYAGGNLSRVDLYQGGRIFRKDLAYDPITGDLESVAESVL